MMRVDVLKVVMWRGVQNRQKWDELLGRQMHKIMSQNDHNVNVFGECYKIAIKR